MIGRYVSWVCWLCHHDEPIWLVRHTCVGWLCPTCLRHKPSAAWPIKRLVG